MTLKVIWGGVLAAVIPLSAAHAAETEADALDEIVVTASLFPVAVAQFPGSVTVLDADTLRAAGVQHFEDVLGLVPNLNWAGGTSRPRFFQLRGIGEVEQYQGAPNPSIGFLIDDIDFSGVGMPATLFDTRQIEVLRGPQGTTYGANALGGLINMRTEDPGRTFELKSEVTAATYAARAAGVAIGDGFGDGASGWRLVAQRYLGDGFRQNAYLGRSSTNGYDEGTLRGKLHWQISEVLTADLALMHVGINNGYDAWSIDNTYTTYSNQPGRDAQVSNGASLRLAAIQGGAGTWQSTTSIADSHIDYSFDGDWGNDALWGANAPYDYYQDDERVRRTVAEDLRFAASPDLALFGRVRWLAGLYALRLTESDALRYVYDDQFNGAGSSELDSRFRATNVALYGNLEADLGPHSLLSAGLRAEQRRASYDDSADAASPFPTQRNRMVGGNLSWQLRPVDGEQVYVTLARGYKGGGFNIGSQILSEQRGFGPESLWSLEAGWKHLPAAGPWQFQVDVFAMRRQQMQVYLSEQLQPNNPLAYVFFTQNASSGENVGLEGEGSLRLAAHWRLSAGASILRTRYLGVSGVFASLGLDGRAQPFAPQYKLSAALDYAGASGWFTRLDSSAVDGFYYYTSDAQTSSAYHLENLRVGRKRGAWNVNLWVRNLFDARYAQQGFYFGLIPPNFPNQSFLQRGDPRQVGITISFDLGRGAPALEK